MQVDLGGCLGERSWLRPFAAALGWVDAYIERMLMAVILVKDEVSRLSALLQACHGKSLHFTDSCSMELLLVALPSLSCIARL